MIDDVIKHKIVLVCEKCNASRSIPVVLTIDKELYTGEERCKDCGNILKRPPLPRPDGE